MTKVIITFGDNENEKQKFYRHEKPIFSKDNDINNILRFVIQRKIVKHLLVT